MSKNSITLHGIGAPLSRGREELRHVGVEIGLDLDASLRHVKFLFVFRRVLGSSRRRMRRKRRHLHSLCFLRQRAELRLP